MWIGRAIQMTVPEIEAVAEANQVPPLHLRAVIQVEALGSGFDKQGRSIVLYEPHVAYRQFAAPGVDPALLQRAVDAGVAYKAWKTRPYPRGNDAQYAQLDRVCAIDAELGVRAASYGIGQVLGENWKLLGFPSALAMVEHAKDSEMNQLDLMIRFMKAKRIIGALATGGAAGFMAFTRVYNGNGQAPEYTRRILAALSALQAARNSEEAPATVPARVVAPRVARPAVAPTTARQKASPRVIRAPDDAERQKTADLNDWALFEARKETNHG